MTDEELTQFINDIKNEDYSGMKFSSRLWEMFDKDKKNIAAYIKPGREFWHYYDSIGYRKLRVTYVRSGVMFFVFDDEPEEEKAWFLGSFNSDFLYAAQIYPYEIGRLLSSHFDKAETSIPKMCKQCKWDDCNGKIKVEVVWDE